MKKTINKYKYYLLFSLLTFVFLCHFTIVGQAVYGDGIHYYAYTRSLVKDHDINFLNERQHHYNHQNNNALFYDSYEDIRGKTKTGLTPNKYPIGAPLLWLPVFIVLDAIANVIHFFNNTFPNNGYSDIYQIGIGVFNIAIIVISSKLLFELLKKIFPNAISIITVLTMLFGSNLFYYGSIDVINSHASSFLFSVLFVSRWWNSISSRTKKQWLILGLLIGALAAIRTQDIIFLTIIVLEMLLSVVKSVKTKKKLAVKKLIINNIYMIIGIVVVFIPQILVWKILYGSFFVSPYIQNGEGFTFTNPQLLGVLFSLKNGLFLWTPIYIFCFIGLFFFWKTKKTITKVFVVFPLLQLYLISSWSGWSQGESFGIRMILSTLPFMSIGFASLLSVIKNRIGLKGIILFSGIIILLNFIAIIYFLAFSQHDTFDRTTNTQEEGIRRIQKVINLIRI